MAASIHSATARPKPTRRLFHGTVPRLQGLQEHAWVLMAYLIGLRYVSLPFDSREWNP